MGIQINGNTNNINAGIGSLSIEDINELDIVGVVTASNFKTGSSNLHSTGLTVGNALVHSTGINVGTGATVHCPSTNALTLGTNSSERIRISSDGYVGISESSPHAGLTVGKLGDYPTSDGNTYYVPEGKWSTSWNSTNAIVDNTDYWVGYTGGYLKNGTSVNISLAPNRGNTNNQCGMYISGEATGIVSADFTVGKIIGGSATGRGTSGNVRATKSELLRITSGGAVQIIGADDQDNLLVKSGNTHFAVHQDDTDGEVSLRSQDGSGSNNSKYMTFYTNPSGSAAAERLRIQSNGYVNIGSGTAEEQLTIRNTSQHCLIRIISGNASGVSAGIDFGDSDDTDVGRIRYYHDNNYMRFDTNAAERLRITSTGQFVVGTNPTVSSGNIVHIEAPTSFNSGETIVNIEGNNAAAAARLVLHNNNTGGSAYNEILGADAGGQSTSSIRFYNTDQSNNYGEIAFGTRNQSGVPPVDRMRISKEGYVNKPYHPAFCATRNGASHIQLANSSNTDVDFPSKDFDNSNSFNTSNGRFTAPIAGKYYFGVQFYCGFSVTSVRVMHAVWKKNGSNSHEADLFGGIGNFGNSSMNHYHPTTNAHVMLELAAGDYVTFNTGTNSFIGSGNTFLYGTKGSRFFGHLVC